MPDKAKFKKFILGWLLVLFISSCGNQTNSQKLLDASFLQSGLRTYQIVAPPNIDARFISPRMIAIGRNRSCPHNHRTPSASSLRQCAGTWCSGRSARKLPVIDAIAERLGATSDGERAAALELALEALYLAKRIDKVTGEGETVYG